MTPSDRELMREARDYIAGRYPDSMPPDYVCWLIGRLDAALSAPPLDEGDDWSSEVMAIIELKCNFAEETRNEIKRRLRRGER